MEPEQFRSLLTVLSRIADALEEYNRMSAENTAQVRAWRSQDEPVIQQRRDENVTIEQERLEIERHILALHKLNAEQEEVHRKKTRQIQEKQARDTNEHFTKAYESWLASLKEQPHD